MADPVTPAGGEPWQALYRRYRPARFAEVLGQAHVTLALRNAVRDGKVAHAYLFSGPRGTGKTSSARILAKALNCAAPVDGEPCCACESCLAIARGASFDVHELDAASNNGVDAMRDLVARAALSTPGEWKVYIVDEVHMLSTAASNALLKTLEEPPSHVVFVLATTDPQKVLPTIRSRTQHFEFHLLPPDTLEHLLAGVSRDAGLELPEGAIDVAVRRGRGSARDALSVLDQVAASGMTEDEAPAVRELVAAIAARDTGLALAAVARALADGRDAQRLAVDLVDQLRRGFLLLAAPTVAARLDASLGAPDAEAEAVRELGLVRCVRAIEVLGSTQVEMRTAADPRVTLEVALARLTHPEADDSPGAILERLERLERAIRNERPGAPERAAPPDPPGPPERSPSPEPPAAQSELDRDAVVAAWGDQVLPALRAKARMLYQAGRFLEVSGSEATFALPNAAHVERAEEQRTEVGRALSEYLRQAVSLRLVVDPGTTLAGDPGRGASRRVAGRTAPSPDLDEPERIEDVLDPDDLAAPAPKSQKDSAVSLATDRLLQAFPGAEEV